MNSTTYVIVLSAITTILTVCIIVFLYKFYRYLFSENMLVGNTIQSRMIILGATSLEFRGFFDALFVQPFILLFDILSKIGNSIYEIISKSKPEINYVTIGNLISNIFLSFTNYFKSYLLTFNFFSGLVFAIILSMVVKAVFYDSVTNQYMINPNLKNYLVGSSFAYVIRQNVALFFLLIGSLYLVLCAMVSISYNSDSIVLNPGDGTSSTAKDSLRLSPGITKVLQLNTTINTQDSLALYTLISSKPDTSLSKIALGILGVNITSIKSNMDNSYRLISQSVTRYNNAVQDFREFQEAKILEIDSKVNSVDLPKKLFNNYKNDIGNWFNQEINQDVQSLEQIQKQISQSITTINFVSNSIVTNYPAFLEALSKIKDENFNQDNLYGYFSPQLVNYYYLSDIDYTRFNSSLGDIKIPPKRGTEWGVLGTSTSWLTTTQSVDLILIVGMFGFGFLGAAISSFVNAQENIKENKPIIENLSVVIIRGFSAAIVIFLATKAGIAIINNGSNEPNPYFLFFSCLIGAVYSERIWDWARSQLKSKYKTADEQEQGVPQQGNLQPPTPQV